MFSRRSIGVIHHLDFSADELSLRLHDGSSPDGRTLAFYLRMENVLASRLACDSHRQGSSTDSWTCLSYDHRAFCEILDEVKKLRQKKGGRLLDVGCGFGGKCWLAQTAGFEAEGIDLCRKYVRVARAILPKRIKVRRRNALTYRHYGDFDVIYAYQPMKNDDNMIKLLERIVDQMRPDALLCGQFFTLIPKTLTRAGDYIWKRK